MISSARTRRPAGLTLIAGTVIALSACGSTDPVAVDGSGGTPYKVSATASFPTKQRIANPQTLRITVRNEEASRTIPDVAVTVRGLQYQLPGGNYGQGTIADRRRPRWIVDEPPTGSQTAFTDTWALGPLAAGEERTFTWKLTPTQLGAHEVTWKVAGDLVEDGPVEATGGPAEGSFDVKVVR